MGTKIPRNDGSYYYSNDPKEDLMKKLVEYTLLAEHQLSFDEASRIPEMYKPNCYAFYYGSFSEAAKIAWSKTRGFGISSATPPVLRKKVPAPKATRSLEPPKVKPSTPPFRLKKAGRKPRFNTEKIVSLLLEYYNKNGRLPSQLEIMNDPTMPCWTTILKYLGPKSNWKDHFQLPSPESSSSTEEPALSTGQPALPVEEPGPTAEESVPPAKEQDPPTEEVITEASYRKEGDTYIIELRIILPDRKNPILLTLIT